LETHQFVVMGADRVRAGDWAIGCEEYRVCRALSDGVVKQRDWVDRRLVDKPGSDDDRVFVGKGLGDGSVGDNKNGMGER
jgi:hypothetical protein